MPENTESSDQPQMDRVNQALRNTSSERSANGETISSDKEKFRKLWEELDELDQERGGKYLDPKYWDPEKVTRTKEIKQQFADNALNMLRVFEDSDDEEKAKVVFVLAQSIDKKDPKSTSRFPKALVSRTPDWELKWRDFTEGIPDEAISDAFISYTMQKRDDFTRKSYDLKEVPDFIEQKAVKAAKTKTTDELIQILHAGSGPRQDPLLRAQVCALLPKELRQQILDTSFPRPEVPTGRGGESIYPLLLMYDFTPEEQRPAIEQIYFEADRDKAGIKIDHVADTLSRWDKEQSEPVIRQFLELAGDKKRSEMRTKFASAVRNWSPDEVAHLLDSVRFASSDIPGDERPETQKLRFALNYLANTEHDFTDPTDVWISKGIAQNMQGLQTINVIRGNQAIFSSELISIFRNRPELLSKYADEGTKVDTSLSQWILNEITQLPLEEQYRYISVFANYFRWSSHSDVSKLAEWDNTHKRSLVKHLLANAPKKEPQRTQHEMDEYQDDDYEEDDTPQLSSAFANNINPRGAAMNILANLPYDVELFDNELVPEAFKEVYGQERSYYTKLESVLKQYSQERPEDTRAILAEWTIRNPTYKDKSTSPFSGLGIEEFTSLDQLLKYLPQELSALSNVDNFNSLEDFYQFVDSNKDLIDFLVSQRGELKLHSEHYNLLKEGALPFSLLETEVLLRGGIDVSRMHKDELLYKKAWQIIKESPHVWTEDETAVLGPFERGAEVFGYRKMFKYVDTELVSHHDALHAFDDILELYQASEMKAKAFYGNILFQVSMDNAQYDEGAAYHQLNSIANSLDKNVNARLAEMRQFAQESNLETLQTFNERFSTAGNIFESWNNLKIYSDRVRILEERKFVTRLSQLRKEGRDSLADYVEKLMFHKDSKINASAIEQFLLDPDGFLREEASHTPTEIQDRKKPSNYIHIPNLDLTAEQLRDTLVDRKLDEIQVFSPMKVEYFMPVVAANILLILKSW